MPGVFHCNHQGALQHPDFVIHYLELELAHCRMIGPFETIPFKGPVAVSPMNIRLKKDGISVRMIIDLSYLHWG